MITEVFVKEKFQIRKGLIQKLDRFSIVFYCLLDYTSVQLNWFC